MLRYAPAPGLRLRLSSFQPLINHHILPPAMRINKNKMKKVIHYDGEQNLNKTNKWREWKQTVIAYYWLFGSSIWKAVAETTRGILIRQHTSAHGKGWPNGLYAETCVFLYHSYEQLHSETTLHMQLCALHKRNVSWNGVSLEEDHCLLSAFLQYYVFVSIF